MTEADDVKLTEQQHDEMVQLVLDGFDFETVAKVMEFLDWRYWAGPGGALMDKVVPDVAMLRATVVDLFRACYAQVGKREEITASGGGFDAHIDSAAGTYSLQFTLEGTSADYSDIGF